MSTKVTMSIMRITFFSVLIMLVFMPVIYQARSQDCLPYEPAKVTLVGQIILRDSYGPPGFGEDPEHDEKRRNIILILPKPICVTRGTEFDVPEYNVREIQLALNDATFEQYKKLRKYVGTKRLFSVDGHLYHSHTGYHVTNVLLFTDRISLEKAQSAPLDAAEPRR
jgi:hypothetical protein